MEKGFTLAEVLITLVIIGIVAAMTIPTLISDTQKREYPIRLAQAFSTLSQAVKMAQVEYGDISTWEYRSLFGTSYTDNWKATKNYVEKYFTPYLKYAKNYGVVDYASIGLEGYKTKKGEMYRASDRQNYILEMANGTYILFGFNNFVDEEDNTYFADPYMFIDVNGKKGPNVTGQDLYMFMLSYERNRLETFGQEKSRDRLLELCNKNSTDNSLDSNLNCTALIQMDGWKFAEDYPW